MGFFLCTLLICWDKRAFCRFFLNSNRIYMNFI